MHEYSIVSALLQRIDEVAVAHRATRVRAVRVAIGESAGVDVALLATAYDNVRQDTICGDAPLEIERVPVRWTCQRCHSAPAAGARLICPACGDPVRLVSGDEIVLDRLELEVP